MRKLSFFRKSITVVLLLSFTLVNSACTDLKAIRAFTESSTEIGKGFPNLAKDLSASCKRQHTFQGIQRNQFQPDRLIAITHPAPGSPEFRKLESKCRTFTEVEAPLIAVNDVLMEYFAAMGALAADDLTAYGDGLDGLGNSLTKANIFEAGEVNAIKGIASFILEASTEGYRRKQLKKALEQNNRNVRIVTAALQRIIAEKYVLQLRNERDQMRSYYSTSILQYGDYMRRVVASRRQTELVQRGHRAVVVKAQDESDVQDPLPIIRVKRIWDEDEKEIQKKIAAAEAYGKAVMKIAEGHQKLYLERDQLGSKEALQIALTYGQTIKSLVDDFREAF